jgi:hypothetical protein
VNPTNHDRAIGDIVRFGISISSDGHTDRASEAASPAATTQLELKWDNIPSQEKCAD